MEIPNKPELKQTASHISSDIDFNDFMNLYKKCTSKPYSFLVIDATLALDNPLSFRKNLIERIQRLITTIRDEKLRCDINREAGKISTLSSEKIDKYEYLSREEILAPDQRREIGQAYFAYSPLGKDFEKQIETIEKQDKKQTKAIMIM